MKQGWLPRERERDRDRDRDVGNGTGNVQREGECKISFNYINYPKCLAANECATQREREKKEKKCEKEGRERGRVEGMQCQCD